MSTYPIIHKFPRGARLFHGTACDAVDSILKKGLAANTFLTTSPKEAEAYARKKAGLVEKVYWDSQDRRGEPHRSYPCIIEVGCMKKPFMWYRSDVDERFEESREINNFFTEEPIPARCVRLWRKL